MTYFSVRMRSAQGGAHEQGGTHVSGGEGLWLAEEVPETVRKLVERAMSHERGEADFIRITVERVDEEQILRVPPLPVTAFGEADVAAGRARAFRLLVESGVSERAARLGLELLAAGPGPGGTVMRGAVLMDARTGERLEKDQARGVRVSRLGWEKETLERWQREQGWEETGKPRISEAVAIASKVVAHPASVAELCWSDDPGYLTGYVASKKLGYCRVTPLKEGGDPMGGRVFFVEPKHLDAEKITVYLENSPVFIQY